jgi:hypothetical protein
VRVSKKWLAAVVAAQAPAPNKTIRKRKRVKGSSHSGDQTSEQEKALANPMKQKKKFRSQSSGPSITEKASSVKLRSAGGKRPRPPWVGAVQARVQHVHWICMICLPLKKRLFHLSHVESTPKNLLRKLCQNLLMPLLS